MANYLPIRYITSDYKRQYDWEYPPDDQLEYSHEYLAYIDDALILEKTPEEIAMSIMDSDNEQIIRMSAVRLSGRLNDMYGERARNRLQQVINDQMVTRGMFPIDWNKYWEDI